MPAELRFNSLAALSEYALQHRPESRAAWYSIQAEAARLDVERAAYWPTLTSQFNLTQSQALSNAGASGPVLNRYGPSLSLSYVLADFGERRAGVEAQRYQLVAALLNNNRRLQDAVSAVEQAYFALHAARAQVLAYQQQETSLKASFDAVSIRLQTGLVSRADQLRARGALAEAEIARINAERNVDKAEVALKLAAGIPQSTKVQLDWVLPTTTAPEANLALADLLDEALRQRPDLQALQASSAAARADAARARAARWPSLNLSGNTARTSFLEDRDTSTTYSVGLTLNVPIFDGGRLRGLARAAERDAQRIEAQQDVYANSVTREVADAFHDARTAQAQRSRIADLLAASTESVQAAEARYRNGVGSLLELLTAQADLARARQTAAQSESDWLAAYSRLSYALGRVPVTAAAP
ncbi:MAG: TolC family protein [Thiobacillus sp.]